MLVGSKKRELFVFYNTILFFFSAAVLGHVSASANFFFSVRSNVF